MTTSTERRLARAIKTDFGGDMSGYRYRVHYSYDTWGHLTQVHQTDTAGPLLWQANDDDAAGHKTAEQFGNGLVTTRTYDPYTQRLATIQTGSAASVQDLSYDWDANGNLIERQDLNQNLTEIFTYDDLNRLQGSTLNGLTNLALSYDAAGNIDTKSGVGSYAYAGSRPHAVTSIALYAGGSITFSYDANGNLLSGDGKTTQWTSYRYPKQISNSANSSVTSFAYGPDRQRVSETILKNGLTAEQRHIIGSLYERETKDGIITHKHHILAGNQVIAIHDRRDDNTTDTRYLHRDHLGSVDTVTDDTGGVITRMSFDAFGQRRDATDWDGPESGTDTSSNRNLTTRGYTGHPMLDDAGYIHMGGRVYDPTLGRFLSPDPNIPDPANSQAFNRYAYVYNNPLSYTDPSGFVPQQQKPKVEEMTQEEWEELWKKMTAQEKKAAQKARKEGKPVAYRTEVTNAVEGSADEGRGEPSGVSDAVDPHDLLGKLHVEDRDGVDTLVGEVAVYVDDRVEDSPETVMGNLREHYSSGKPVEQGGKKYAVDITFSLTTDITNADHVVAPCPRNVCTPHSDRIAQNNIGTARTEVGKWGDRTYTYAHEFGHALGLYHQWNSTGSLMSYASTRSLTYSDVSRLVEAYW